MKKAKIKSVGTPKEYVNDKGTFYYFQIEMDNGDKGSIGSKDSSPSFLSVGAELSYEFTETDKGNKIKRVNDNPFKGGGKFDSTGQMVGACQKMAVDMYIHGKFEDIKRVESTAKWLCEMSIRLKAEFEGK